MLHLQGVAVQAVVTEYLIKYCHLIFTSPSQNNTPRTGNRMSVHSPHLQQFPISSPIKLLSLQEAQEQYQKMSNKRNHILPLHSLTLNTRKKAKYWSKKTFFSKKREEILEENPLCPCFSSKTEGSPPGGSCCRCLSKFDPDSSSDIETTFLTSDRSSDTDQEQSPVILRCLRRGHSSDTDTGSGGRMVNKRSSLRDKFRKFALSPISSSHNIMEKLEDAKTSFSLASQHVNQRMLHLNESLEFIDASSEEDEESDSELSPSIKRSKIVTRLPVVTRSSEQKARASILAQDSNHVISSSIKQPTEKSEANQEAAAAISEDTKVRSQIITDKVNPTSSNQINPPRLNSFPVRDASEKFEVKIINHNIL